MTALLRGLLALAVALALAATLLAATGQPPWDTLRALLLGGTGSAAALSGTVARATPLLLTGSAVALALTAGRFNIGAEGQLAVGALVAAAVAVALPVPAPVATAVGLVLGALAGGLWALPASWLRERRGTHEVITALLLNYVARNLTHYLAAGPWREPSGQAPQTATILAPLPRLEAGGVHVGLLVALPLALLVSVGLARGVAGFELRWAGAAAEAARRAGVPVERLRHRAFLLSGALCGLAGGLVVCGETPFRRFPADFYGVGYGFDGLAIALMADGAPLMLAPLALLFAAIGEGARAMEFETGTPRQLGQVVEALVVLAVSARFVIRRRR